MCNSKPDFQSAAPPPHTNEEEEKEENLPHYLRSMLPAPNGGPGWDNRSAGPWRDPEPSQS